MKSPARFSVCGCLFELVGLFAVNVCSCLLMQVGGAKKLYRHFLKKPDGCIMEVFGDVSMQLQQQQSAVERLLMEQGQAGYGTLF